MMKYDENDRNIMKEWWKTIEISWNNDGKWQEFRTAAHGLHCHLSCRSNCIFWVFQPKKRGKSYTFDWKNSTKCNQNDLRKRRRKRKKKKRNVGRYIPNLKITCSQQWHSLRIHSWCTLTTDQKQQKTLSPLRMQQTLFFVNNCLKTIERSWWVTPCDDTVSSCHWI